MSDPQTLAEVRAGDTVYLFEYGAYRPMVVSKVTKLHVILPDGVRYRLLSGQRAAASDYNPYSQVPTIGVGPDAQQRAQTIDRKNTAAGWQHRFLIKAEKTSPVQEHIVAINALTAEAEAFLKEWGEWKDG